MELKNYLNIFKKWWLVIAFFTALTTLLTTILVFTIPPTYKASTLLIVNQAQGATINLNDVMTAERLARTYAEVVTKRPVLEAVITQLNLPLTTTELGKKIEVQLIRDTQLINIAVADKNPGKAALIANAVTKAFQDEIQKIQRASLSSDASINSIGVVEQAKTPDKPYSPKKALSILLAFILGLTASATLVFLIEYLDDTLKSEADIKNFLGVNNLGVISYIKEEHRQPGQIVTLIDPQSTVTEAFREIRTNIQFASANLTSRSIVITSASPAEGKSLTCANLAVVMAQAGYKTLLIDADLRKPIQHEIFKLENNFGISSLLTAESFSDLNWQETLVPGLFVITAGPFLPNPTEWLGSTRMHRILEKIKEKGFHVVLFDSPPVGMVTDAAVLSSMTNAAIITIEAAKTSRDDVAKAIEAIQRVGGIVLGTILNYKKPSRTRGKYYYEKRYYEQDKSHL